MLRPDLLTHPNIPKPLHGINPRTIKGQKWWDVTRRKVYEKQNYKCAACGVHKSKAKYHNWLECHESYTIDYNTGEVVIHELVALCHSCHNFIHSGRLEKLYLSDKITKDKFKSILEDGLKLTLSNNYVPYYNTLLIYGKYFNKRNFIEKGNDEYKKFKCNISWNKWCLIFEGKKYYSKYKNIREWEEAYKG